jgi:hypothetical protein
MQAVSAEAVGEQVPYFHEEKEEAYAAAMKDTIE